MIKLENNSEYIVLSHLKSVKLVTCPNPPHFKVISKPADPKKEEQIMTQLEEILGMLKVRVYKEKKLTYVKR